MEFVERRFSSGPHARSVPIRYVAQFKAATRHVVDALGKALEGRRQPNVMNKSGKWGFLSPICQQAVDELPAAAVPSRGFQTLYGGKSPGLSGTAAGGHGRAAPAPRPISNGRPPKYISAWRQPESRLSLRGPARKMFAHTAGNHDLAL